MHCGFEEETTVKKVGRPTEYHRRIPWSVTTALIEEAARLRGLTPWDVTHLAKKKRTARTRFGVIWVLRQHNVVMTNIADHIGMTDYTSVYHGAGVATMLRDTDPEYRDFTDKLLAFSHSLFTDKSEQDAEAA